MKIEELKILTCDDSMLARKSIRDALRNAGCRNIIEVHDGQQAVEMYRKEKPHIAFLDIVMPVKDGITAAREIIAEDPDAYIVMVSSVGTRSHLQKALDAGARDFLQKPPTREQIRDVLELVAEGVQ